MALIYLAFANDESQPLDQLKAEYKRLQAIYEPLEAKGLIQLKIDPYADLDRIVNTLSQFKNEILLFHYAGHATQEGILLDGKLAKSKGLSTLFAQCEALKLVILNGCSTKAQVALLQEAKIPAIIGTAAPIGDRKAVEFASQLHQQLALSDSLGQAFTSAQGKIQAGSDLPFYRGQGLVSTNDQENTWGLFLLPGRTDMEDWKIPLFEKRNIPDTYQANAQLIKVLSPALAPFHPLLKKIDQEEKLGLPSTPKQKRKGILQALPHPLSEHLRKLLTPESGQGKAVFYDRAGVPRFKQMLHLYRTLSKLMAYALFAQTWDVYQQKSALRFAEDELEQIRGFFRQSYQESQHCDYFEWFLKFHQLFQHYQYPFFIKELEALSPALETGSELRNAALQLENYYQQGLDRKVDQVQASALCPLIEDQLSVLLRHFAFVANYSLTSVKNIRLINYRNQTNPLFRHKVVRLVQEFVGLDEEALLSADYADTTSVLLIEKNETQELPSKYLNLSPFIIDLNAFDAKASLAKLHFLDHYIKEQNAFSYRHIYMPEDNPLVVNDKMDYYPIILSQFDFFSDLLFKQPLHEAI